MTASETKTNRSEMSVYIRTVTTMTLKCKGFLEAVGHRRGFKRLAYLDSYRREDLSLEDRKPWVRRSGLDDPVPILHRSSTLRATIELCT